MPSFEYNGVVVQFPFEPYPIQKDYMKEVIDSIKNGENAMLESPTGTGKTLCLLCSSLATMDFENKREPIVKDPPPKKEKTSFFDMIYGKHTVDKSTIVKGKIIYASRTHSQISQVIRELKKTQYHPKTMVLGSRENLCINENVNSDPVFVLNRKCRSDKFSCPYKASFALDGFATFYSNPSVPNGGIMDIEELYKFGEKHAICPYYLSRYDAIILQSELILMPYNYLIDPFIRETLPFDLKSCVVIIDEAHNVDGFCLESMSTNINSPMLDAMEKEVRKLLDKDLLGKMSEYKSGNKQEQLQERTRLEILFTILLRVLQGIEKELQSTINKSKSSEYIDDGSYMYTFLKSVGIDSSSITVITTYLDEAISVIYNHSTKTDCQLEMLRKLLQLLFPNGRALPLHLVNQYKFIAYNEIQKRNNKPFPTLGLWCMDPGKAIQQIVAENQVRCMIFTSGTLSPMQPLIQDFRIPIKHVLENNHVIKDHQLMVISIDKGIHDIPLSSSYASRQNPAMRSELFNSIYYLLPEIRGNVIVFFPSYSFLEDCYIQWERDGFINKMQSIKQVLKESSNGKEDNFKENVRALQEAVYHKGAILFAVCRGKASEGLDFSNDLCRCVIVTGIPYPPAMDPKVRLRRLYMDERYAQQVTLNKRVKDAVQHHQSFYSISHDDLPLASLMNTQSEPITGSSWYNISAYRAVNQAVGRAIRNKDDYGIIILFDERFISQMNSLSKWLHPFFHASHSIQKIKGDIRNFFDVNSGSYQLPQREQIVKQIRSQSTPTVMTQFTKKMDFSKQIKVSKPSRQLGVLGSSLNRLRSAPAYHVIEEKKEEKKETNQSSLKSSFCSRLKEVPSVEVLATPKKNNSAKGIKRFFHSDEVNRAQQMENGAFVIKEIKNDPTTRQALFSKQTQ